MIFPQGAQYHSQGQSRGAIAQVVLGHTAGRLDVLNIGAVLDELE